MMPPAIARPNDNPNYPAAEFTPCCFAHPLLLDGSQRVVVELGHQQAQSSSGDQQGNYEGPAGLGARHDRDDERNAEGAVYLLEHLQRSRA
jgi:hypothetical protein